MKMRPHYDVWSPTVSQQGPRVSVLSVQRVSTADQLLSGRLLIAVLGLPPETHLAADPAADQTGA